MSSLETFAKGLVGTVDLLQVAIRALDAIGELVKLPIKHGDKQLETLTAISSIVDAIRDGFAGKVDVTKIEAEIAAMRKMLSHNDAAADSALDKKFPGR